MPFKVADALAGVKMAMVDAALKASRKSLQVYGQGVRCRKGCAGCCSRMITLTVAEASVMVEHLVASGSWPGVRERAARWARASGLANERSWFLMDVPCAALDPETRTCLAYEVRPTPCSVHFALSDPEACQPLCARPEEFVPVEVTEVHEEFLKRLDREVDGYGVLGMRLPMPAALLLAERVRANARLTAEEITSFVRSELT